MNRSGHWPQAVSTILLSLLVAFYLATTLYIASHRPFWFDEISTIMIARVNTYGDIWHALTDAADLPPPTYFMLVRPFDQWFGPGEIGVRIPSALAMIIGMLVTFDCSRRASNGLYGLIAVSLLTCSLLPYYGFEARPYSIYFALAAFTFWLWVHTKDRAFASILFGTAFFLAFLVHYYSVLCLVPYAAAVILEPRQWRARVGKFAAGCVGVACGAVLTLGPILAARQLASSFWATPSFDKLRDIFPEFFPAGALLFVAGMLWNLLVNRESKSILVPPMSLAERDGWLFLLIPLIGFVVAKLGTNAFYNRYFIGMLPGIVFAFSCFLWRRFKALPQVSIGILSILSVVGIRHQVVAAVHAEMIDPPSAKGETALVRRVLQLEDMFRGDAKPYVVFSADEILGLEARYYTRHPERYVLLVDNAPGLNARTMMRLSRYSPISYWHLDDLKSHAREAALINPSGKAMKFLNQSGFEADTRFFGPVQVVYLR